MTLVRPERKKRAWVPSKPDFVRTFPLIYYHLGNRIIGRLPMVVKLRWSKPDSSTSSCCPGWCCGPGGPSYRTGRCFYQQERDQASSASSSRPQGREFLQVRFFSLSFLPPSPLPSFTFLFHKYEEILSHEGEFLNSFTSDPWFPPLSSLALPCFYTILFILFIEI